MTTREEQLKKQLKKQVEKWSGGAIKIIESNVTIKTVESSSRPGLKTGGKS